MNSRILKAIVKKDLKDIFRSKSLLTTLIIIPILFSVIIPAILVGSALVFDLKEMVGNESEKLIELFMAEVKDVPVPLETEEQQFVYIFINYLLPSLFFLVPIITASTVAANSFVGKRSEERLKAYYFHREH